MFVVTNHFVRQFGRHSPPEHAQYVEERRERLGLEAKAKAEQKQAQIQKLAKEHAEKQKAK